MSSRTRFYVWGIALAILLLSIGLRLININRGMWGDEITTHFVMTETPESIVHERLAHGHLPTYFLLAREWVRFWGLRKASLRSLSLIPAALAAALLFLFCARWFSVWIGIWAAALFSFNSINLFISQAARMYGLTLLGEVLLFIFFLGNWFAPSRRRYWAYAIVVAVSCLIHLLFLRMALVVFVFLIWGPGRPKESGRATWARVARYLCPYLVGLALLPVFCAMRDAGPTIPPTARRHDPSRSLKEMIALPLGQLDYWDSLDHGAQQEAVRVLIIGLTGLLVAAGFRLSSKVSAVERVPRPPSSERFESSEDFARRREILWYALIWGVLPGLVLILGQMLFGAHGLAPRYVVGSTAAWAVLLAVGAASLRVGPWVRRGLVCALVGFSAFLGAGWLLSPGDGLPETLNYWRIHSHPGEKVFMVHQGYWQWTMRIEGLPELPDHLVSGLSLEHPTQQELADHLRRFAAGEKRLWVFHYFRLSSATLTGAFRDMGDGWSASRVFSLGRARLYCLTREGNDPAI